MKKRVKKKEILVGVLVIVVVAVSAFALNYFFSADEIEEPWLSPGGTCSVCIYGPDNVYEQCKTETGYKRTQCEINAKDRFKRLCEEKLGGPTDLSVGRFIFPAEDFLTDKYKENLIQPYCSYRPCNNINIYAMHHGSQSVSEAYAAAYVKITRALCECNGIINVNVESGACYATAPLHVINYVIDSFKIKLRDSPPLGPSCSFTLLGSQTKNFYAGASSCSDPIKPPKLLTPTKFIYKAELSDRFDYELPRCNNYVNLETGIGNKCYKIEGSDDTAVGEEFYCGYKNEDGEQTGFIRCLQLNPNRVDTQTWVLYT